MTKQELPNKVNSSNQPPPLFGACITIGFGSAIIMWMIAWILHMPGVSVPTPVSIAILLIPLFTISFLWSSNLQRQSRLKAGAISGLIAGFVNLMILGSDIVEQPESTAQMSEQANNLAPNAAVTIIGSIILSAIIGLVAGALNRSESRESKSSAFWTARLGWVTALTYLPLIAVGGVVTTTDSGLAVPDAVTSYGAVSILFPLELMSEPRIFLEHSHRLFGTLAGLTTLVLMIRALIKETRLLPKLFSITLFVSVCIQGYMGIIRVAEESTFFAILHGVYAQLILGLALANSIILAPKWLTTQPSVECNESARKGRVLIVLTVIALCLQLILGAVTRHMNSGHAMMTHMGFAVIALFMTILGGAICMRVGKVDKSGSMIRPYGSVLHGLVVLQFTLGFAVLGMGWSSEDVPELPTAETLSQAAPIETGSTLVTTGHHIIGALLLATAFGSLMWIMRLAHTKPILAEESSI